MTKHVAAWDLPSLDYLSEEQTLKYLRKHEEDVRRREQLQLNNQGRYPLCKDHTRLREFCVRKCNSLILWP